ncbi:hypothetical protein D3C73_654810 [compost metagenome]
MRQHHDCRLAALARSAEHIPVGASRRLAGGGERHRGADGPKRGLTSARPHLAFLCLLYPLVVDVARLAIFTAVYPAGGQLFRSAATGAITREDLAVLGALVTVPPGMA